ncbi:undecaprenyldiphospho-muramoylpentapeptide beta-N-acetylglucosaminyltransferase [Cognatilysobacter bugurensis]|uniref:UDP-N-acetylglucosamine--N-acetylmuramyl-(pentapeptide) pyrophosphoryl-undecaprenol N-acetylglucosamine transferase n=1 Tax=Cognatilysobacter bugurensis TaxID=543356 RepID=A0A918T2B3_9GAMM|nr:undecaprenyldiphospho-muramoylpentapeptide beta-N-acetylglucosaminyltransferase [Lysobacter bugurensis]GHA85120.1 UDP-N-acetylglucosamine--N-acetylmuramyl-(pentapeptide) pyrophosphoryl-undecaprenol N-acetylglucosamine transferase [Lysobacter bugurensis]
MTSVDTGVRMGGASTASARPVLILAGGTGGHIFPGLAVAQALRERGVPVRWLGADGGMETRLVPQHGIAIDTIPVRGVRGKGLTTLLRAPLHVLQAASAARRVLDATRPAAVISFGGYAAGPGGIAARMAGVPLIVHEQNRAPGLTNRVLARAAQHVLTGFPDTFGPTALRTPEQVVGNPVRESIAALPPPAQRFGGREGPLRLLVLGGSQGARALNAAVPAAVAALRGETAFDVRHQCGEKMLDDARRAYAEAGVDASVEPFIADMAEAYAWADLVVCRAGALTLAEVCAAGVGSVLVPFPQAVDDHQTKNARYLVERGAAVLLPQSEDLAERLVDALRSHADRARLLELAQAARAIAKPDAARDVADIVLHCMGASARPEPVA